MTTVKITVCIYINLDHRRWKSQNTSLCKGFLLLSRDEGCGMKDCFFTTCLKPLNFNAKRACRILSTLVIEMQLPETREGCCMKQEKGSVQ